MAKTSDLSAKKAALLNYLTENPVTHIRSIATALNMHFIRLNPDAIPDISPLEANAISNLLDLTCYLADLADLAEA